MIVQLLAEASEIVSRGLHRRYVKQRESLSSPRGRIKVLTAMPRELIEDGFAELAADKSFSQKMRDKFRAVIASADGLGDDWF